MKKSIKIISALLIVMMIAIMFNQVYAATRCTGCHGSGYLPGSVKCYLCDGIGWISETTSTGDIIEDAGSFIDKGAQDANNKIDLVSLKDLSDTLYNTLLVIGIVAAIIVGLIMGIKFILGSIEEKAEIKEMVIPYIIGCIVVFGAFTIWQIVVNILQSV